MIDKLKRLQFALWLDPVDWLYSVPDTSAQPSISQALVTLWEAGQVTPLAWQLYADLLPPCCVRIDQHVLSLSLGMFTGSQ